MSPAMSPIVVDNASQDETVALAGAARVIANGENRGFAAAANQGVAATDSDLILLMNPDVTLLSPVDAMAQAAAAHGLAGGKLVDSEGRAQAGFAIRRFPTPARLIFELFGINRLWRGNPLNRRYRYMDRSLEQAGPVEQPPGAFLMFRRDVWEKLGGFDEGFHPIWFEDVDFCRRAVDAGFRIEYVPQVVARHEGADSIAQVPPGCRAWYWYVSLLRYAAKHFGRAGYRAVSAAVVLSSVPRMLAGIIRERSTSPVAVYCKIAWFASRCLVSFGRRGAVEVQTS